MPYKDRERARARSKVYCLAHRDEKAIYNKIYDLSHHEERLAYKRAQYLMNREKRLVYCRTRRDAKHKELLAYEGVYRLMHRKEIAIRMATWAKTHPQEVNEKNRKRDALKRGATIGPIDLTAIKARDKMRCAICGKRVAKKDLSFDHSWPLSLGGPHSQENQRVAHRRCNIKRGAGRIPVQMVLC